MFSYDDNGFVTNKYVFTACATSQHRTDFTYSYDRQGNVKDMYVIRNGEEIKHWNFFNERGLLAEVKVAESSTEPSSAELEFAYTPSGLIKTKKVNENSESKEK